MTAPGGKRPNPLFYYGVVESMARAGAGTHDIWERLRAEASRAGLERVGLSGAEVSRLRGMAGGVLRAEREFAAADDSYNVRGGMVGLAPWARPWALREAMPKYQVRFTHTTMQDGVISSATRTTFFNMGVPPTKGDLLAAIEQDARQMADKYQQEHVSISDIGILEV